MTLFAHFACHLYFPKTVTNCSTVACCIQSKIHFQKFVKKLDIIKMFLLCKLRAYLKMPKTVCKRCDHH